MRAWSHRLVMAGLLVGCEPPIVEPARGEAIGPTLVLDVSSPMEARTVRVCPESEWPQYWSTITVEAVVRRGADTGVDTPRVGVSVSESDEWTEGPVPESGTLELSVSASTGIVLDEFGVEEDRPHPCDEGLQVVFERLDPGLVGAVEVEWMVDAAVVPLTESDDVRRDDLKREVIHVHIDP